VKRIIPGVLVALLVSAAVTPLLAQSLAEVARREEERRKAITSSGKLYTNESLRAEPPPPAPQGAGALGAPPSTPPVAAPAPAAPPPAAAGQPAAPGAQPPQAPGQPAAGQPPAAPQTEADWKKRMTAARDALARSQTFAEALQTRINALSTDFVNRDDPAQREQIAADRQKALLELDRVRQEIQDQQKAIAAIQEEARKAGVPAGWVR
jgi:hypothetical protein